MQNQFYQGQQQTSRITTQEPTRLQNTQQQQQQHSLLSQASWGRLEMKPKRHKGQGSGTLIASLQALLFKANSSEISQSLSQGYKTHTHENYKTSENKNIVNHVSRTDLKQLGCQVSLVNASHLIKYSAAGGVDDALKLLSCTLCFN